MSFYFLIWCSLTPSLIKNLCLLCFSRFNRLAIRTLSLFIPGGGTTAQVCGFSYRSRLFGMHWGLRTRSWHQSGRRLGLAPQPLKMLELQLGHFVGVPPAEISKWTAGNLFRNINARWYSCVPPPLSSPPTSHRGPSSEIWALLERNRSLQLQLTLLGSWVVPHCFHLTPPQPGVVTSGAPQNPVLAVSLWSRDTLGGLFHLFGLKIHFYPTLMVCQVPLSRQPGPPQIL